MQELLDQATQPPRGKKAKRGQAKGDKVLSGGPSDAFMDQFFIEADKV